MRAGLKIVFFAGVLAAMAARGQEGDFVERFALSEDRAAVLEELIPGTEPYYYFSCLLALHEERYADVDTMLTAWIEKHGRTELVRRIQMREALLEYGTQPEDSLAYLKSELGLYFNHQREVAGQTPQYPTSLPEDALSRERLTAIAMDDRRYRDSVEGFENRAFEWLDAGKLSPERRRAFLQRLDRPDYPGLSALILADLEAPRSQPFSSMGVHGQLTLAQLDELAALKPELLNQDKFVTQYLLRLQPNPDVDWKHDPAAKTAYIERLEAFAGRLGPAWNSLKAHVLYQRLEHDRSLGVYDQARFLAYLRLPRPMPYVLRGYLAQAENQRYTADLNADFSGRTLLPPIGGDESLVRAYLAHFFQDAPNYRAFEAYIEENYLRAVFAETKILAGQGDMEAWHAWLDPAQYQALKDRVDIEFDAANPREFAVAAPVVLDVWVKNVDTLLVKVFEINTPNYYRQFQRHVNTDIDLDGLVAHEEQVFKYEDAPLRRVKRTFRLSGMEKPGVYVVEFIGNGKSSRALVRKGRLSYLARTSAAGQLFSVLDEENRVVKDATLYLEGHEYAADEAGVIAVPFTANPGRRPVVLQRGQFAYLDYVERQAEQYTLSVGFHVDREALQPGALARVAVRPALYVNGTPVPLKLLEKPVLSMRAVDVEGTETSSEVHDFELFDERLALHEFRVPANLIALTFTLSGQVENLTQHKKDDLNASQAFALNRIQQTDELDALLFSRDADGYYIEKVGKNGERKGDRAVTVELKHRDFRDTITYALRTDEGGRIALGPLADVAWVRASHEGSQAQWMLEGDECAYPSAIFGQAGETLRLPYMGTANAVRHAEYSLYEIRNGKHVRDCFDALSLRDGYLVIDGLARGDYWLMLKEPQQLVTIRLTDGAAAGKYVLSKYRQLERGDATPLQITGVDAAGGPLKVRLANAGPGTRVHVVATRFEAAYPLREALANVAMPGSGMRVLQAADSQYISGRNIGDEYRYILDRKYAEKYPGNMLERPGLLLNPWAVSKTETERKEPEAGEPPAASPAPALAMDAQGEALKRERGQAAESSAFPSLDFLSDDAAVLLNLEPDAQGVVTVPREALHGRQMVHVLAADAAETVYREVALPMGAVATEDLRLARALDPDGHFAEQKQMVVLKTGDTLDFADPGSADFEVYDTIGKVRRLFLTLNADANLTEFEFITRWGDLDTAEKATLYAKYACHELNFFIHEKDPEFFESVVRPYLENKYDKTFMDEWLLERDCAQYLEPWAYQQLNLAERILLAERAAGERERMQRHVRDRVALIPPDVERFNWLFTTGLSGGAFDTGRLASGMVVADQVQPLVYFAGRAGGAGYGGGGYGSAAGGFGGGGLDGGGFGGGGAFGVNARNRSRGMADKEAKAVQELASLEAYSLNAPVAVKGASAVEMCTKLGVEADFFQDIDGDGINRDGVLENIPFYRKMINGDVASSAAVLEEVLARRQAVRELYERLETTEEYAENNYYMLPITQQGAELIPVNAFWQDYAERDPGAPFLSPHFAEAAANFTEMMLALSVMDLPYEAPEHKTAQDGDGFHFTASGPAVVFYKEIRPVETPKEPSPVLVSENFFREGDRYTYEGNQQIDKFVTGEMLAQQVYGCRVTITNPASVPVRLDVLLEIPRGALPVRGGKKTKSMPMQLEAYSTQNLEYYFYFPEPGDFGHFPVHVSRGGELAASAAPRTIHVVRVPSTVDKASWDYISQNGSEEDVLRYIGEENVNRVNLDRIAWRMKDKDFYRQALAHLDAQHVFVAVLWSYSLMHDDVPAMRTYLQFDQRIARWCGAYIDSQLLTLDPVARRAYEHLEYKPLVNARAHQLGAQRVILNDRFRAQYGKLMEVLTQRPKLDADDLLAVTYYLLLQDRVGEALAAFARVDEGAVAARVQYDYLDAYLALYTEEPARARRIVTAYQTYPQERWRKLFDGVAAQLNEIEGAATRTADEESRQQRQDELAAAQPGFDFVIEGTEVRVVYQNLETCKVNYYLMDVELLFSRNPFVQEDSGRFASIRPNRADTLALSGATGTKAFDLPDEFHNRNVLVEIVAGGVRKTHACYANALAVQAIEQYGQVLVRGKDGGAPVAKVYVKVYARMRDGAVRFYKDGYTDLRGRFDYATLSTNDLDNVERFALLLMSEDAGALVMEAAPPRW